MEELEMRLKNSFEEKEEACRTLLATKQTLRLQMSAQHAHRRLQLGTHRPGRWVELIWRDNPVWSAPTCGRMLAGLDALASQQRMADDQLTHVSRRTTVILEALAEASRLLPSSASCGVGSTAGGTAGGTAGSETGGGMGGGTAGGTHGGVCVGVCGGAG
eukprot:CAMPEP_0174694238 /NCGR_PEP_ID=MMETSP1094-20130205/850_1 /TAXON_ID=156173 /ORGANISM="Chrysochromulina brevifilum, Strain UTEX LB 985" /LENGTH=159 /DNA_ID=CAMNT_0015890405 /DNA_START=49 /DNA_END=524 /DNA_ORIENTATION=+